ncbi:hypothetical protein [Mycobacterium sp. NAZ190054]|uniref:hypothetical protein n=1 Tax=Mycobacterium sp. NAZ190054 TaxID=1747766 RepID=UPI001E4F965E|nr:hypothetical protein [Mycobacterium sp. NAZ190054]
MVCTATGTAGLATAISTVEHDGQVFLAGIADAALAGEPYGLRGCFARVGDEATVEYFAALTEDLDLAALTQQDPDLPVRLMTDTAPARGRTVPPFEGWRLRDWAAVCIASPSGYLYTQVTDWPSTTMPGEAGEWFEITELGVMTPEPEDPVGSVHRWLSDEADDRGLSPYPVERFDRLVFEDGRVVGAVFTTDTGALTVRARHGVLICGDDVTGRSASGSRLPGETSFRVALVGKDASRFGRVELLTSDPAVA